MAKSKFEYVRLYEQDDKLLKNVWIVVRIDGKGFHKFSHELITGDISERFCDILARYY